MINAESKGGPLSDLDTSGTADVLEMDNADQKALNNYFTKSINGNKFDINVELKDEDDEIQKLPKGKEIIKEDIDNIKDDEKTKENPEKNELIGLK